MRFQGASAHPDIEPRGPQPPRRTLFEQSLFEKLSLAEWASIDNGKGDEYARFTRDGKIIVIFMRGHEDAIFTSLSTDPQAIGRPTLKSTLEYWDKEVRQFGGWAPLGGQVWGDGRHARIYEHYIVDWDDIEVGKAYWGITENRDREYREISIIRFVVRRFASDRRTLYAPREHLFSRDSFELAGEGKRYKEPLIFAEDDLEFAKMAFENLTDSL